MNLIPAVRPILDGLIAVEYRLDRTLYLEALRLAGE